MLADVALLVFLSLIGQAAENPFTVAFVFVRCNKVQLLVGEGPKNNLFDAFFTGTIWNALKNLVIVKSLVFVFRN